MMGVSRKVGRFPGVLSCWTSPLLAAPSRVPPWQVSGSLHKHWDGEAWGGSTHFLSPPRFSAWGPANEIDNGRALCIPLSASHAWGIGERREHQKGCWDLRACVLTSFLTRGRGERLLGGNKGLLGKIRGPWSLETRLLRD